MTIAIATHRAAQLKISSSFMEGLSANLGTAIGRTAPFDPAFVFGHAIGLPGSKNKAQDFGLDHNVRDNVLRCDVRSKLHFNWKFRRAKNRLRNLENLGQLVGLQAVFKIIGGPGLQQARRRLAPSSAAVDELLINTTNLRYMKVVGDVLARRKLKANCCVRTRGKQVLELPNVHADPVRFELKKLVKVHRPSRPSITFAWANIWLTEKVFRSPPRLLTAFQGTALKSLRILCQPWQATTARDAQSQRSIEIVRR